jgi:fatty acid-binding protein DegV
MDRGTHRQVAVVTDGTPVRMAVLHVAAPEEAAPLREDLQARFHPIETIEGECGPVIGTHAGPGTVGVALYID